MSLDVYLYGPETTRTCECSERGHEHTLDRKECLFSQNITHNLGAMAREGGFYEKVWRPEESGVATAVDLIEPLTRAIADMKADPERFKKHNAPNGWGLYEHFVPWLQNYLDACKENPEATVYASR